MMERRRSGSRRGKADPNRCVRRGIFSPGSRFPHKKLQTEDLVIEIPVYPWNP